MRGGAQARRQLHAGAAALEPGQLAWLLGEYGAAEEHARFVEVALLFAAVLAFPDQVGYPSAWDRDGVSNCVAFLRAGGHKAILKIGAAKHLEKNAAVAERCAQVVMGLAMDEVDAAVGSTTALNAAGAPAALAAAIRTHLEVEGVQDAAVKALSSLSASADSEPSASAVFCRTAVLEQGGLGAAVLPPPTRRSRRLRSMRRASSATSRRARPTPPRRRSASAPSPRWSARSARRRPTPTSPPSAAPPSQTSSSAAPPTPTATPTPTTAAARSTSPEGRRPPCRRSGRRHSWRGRRAILDRVPEVAVGVLRAGHSGVAGQEACEGACALLSNIATWGSPRRRAVGAEMGLNAVLAQYPQESTQTIARRALSALVGSYE